MSEPQTLKISRTNFLLVLSIVFLTQIPGCIIVCADDAGQIDSYKHEKLIQFSVATFAFPLKLFIHMGDSWASLIFVYIGNIVLVSCFIMMLLFIWKSAKKQSRGKTTSVSTNANRK